MKQAEWWVVDCVGVIISAMGGAVRVDGGMYLSLSSESVLASEG